MPESPVASSLSGSAPSPDPQRYGRHLVLDGFGMRAQRLLAGSRVLVIGAGGLGSPVIQYLAGAGVGVLGIADDDAVALSNLPRQVLHATSAVGEPKTASAARAVAALNPEVTVVQHGRADAQTAGALVGGYDLVVDASDTFGTALVLDAACAAAGIPLVWGSVLRWDGQVTVFAPAGPDGGRRLADLYPGVDGSEAEDCAVAGVIGPVCGAVGSVMATEAIKLLTGVGTPLVGALLVHDGLDGSWRRVEFAGSGANSAVPAGALDTAAAAPTTAVPEEPESLSARELAERLQVRELGFTELTVLDVREPWEHELVAIPGAELLPLGELRAGRMPGLDPQAEILVHCHHDTRSRLAVALLRKAGFPNARWIRGGIDAWSREVDPSAPRY